MNLPEFSIWIFTAGLAGALAPEIIRLYKIKNNPELFKWSWFYLIISLLFILLGGFVAWILPTTSLWGAFYAGVSLPIIISSIGKSKKLIESEKSSEKEEQSAEDPQKDPHHQEVSTTSTMATAPEATHHQATAIR